MERNKNPLVKLYDYQQDFINDKSRFKIGIFSRQTGKTFICTLDIVLQVLTAESVGAKSDWVIFSATERQGKLALKSLKTHFQALKIVFDPITRYLDDIEEKITEIKMPNGSMITVATSNPDSIRGYSCNVYADEFAFHKNSHEVWKALFPIVTNGFKLMITSTPNGVNNKFYELVHETNSLWSKHFVDIHQAIDQGLPLVADILKNGLNDPVAWSQEYLIQFKETNETWLKNEVLNKNQHECLHMYTGKYCYVGVDISRRGDLFVIYVLEDVNNHLYTREIIARKNITFQKQDQLLKEIIQKYKVARIYMDQTGMGEKPVEDAQRLYGSSLVRGIIATNKSKQDLANAILHRFEDSTITIPYDPVLKEDLQAVKRLQTKTGLPQFEGGRTTDGHADRFWALSLAILSYDQNKGGSYEYITKDDLKSSSFRSELQSQPSHKWRC